MNTNYNEAVLVRAHDNVEQQTTGFATTMLFVSIHHAKHNPCIPMFASIAIAYL